MAQPPRRSFPGPQGAISSLRKELYIVQRAASNEELLKHIRAGKYVLMHGHRMCGKSTRMFHLIENSTTGFRGLWVSIQELTCGSVEAPRDHDVDAFWRAMQDALHYRYCDLFPTASAKSNTADACLKVLKAVFMAEHEVPLVLFFDELDLLVAANPAVKDSFLGFVRSIRQDQSGRAKPTVLAIVGIGSYEVLKLAAVAGGASNADPAFGAARVTSPFNVGDDFKEQHFLLPELKAVVDEYTADHGVTLPEHFIDDLFGSTHGHPGLTMMAMRDYHEHAVLQRGRNYGSVLPSWDIFCRTHFWDTMLSNVSLLTAVGAVTSSQLCCSFIERKGLLLRNDSFDLGVPEPGSEDALAIRWMMVHGLIRHDEHDGKRAVWTCPLFRMHVLCVLRAGLIDVPPIIPVMHLGGGNKRILLVELLKLLIPRVSTTLLAHELVKNKTTGAPHEYAYQCELFALLSWAFTRDIGGDNPRVIPEAKELGGGRRRIDLVAYNHGVYAIELGANMDQHRHDEHYQRTCGYVEFLRQAYPDKHVSAVLINFTTDEKQCTYFPSNTRNDISLLNVRVWLDDPAKNVYYVYEPTSSGGVDVAGQLARLTIGTSPRSTPLKAKVSGTGGQLRPRMLFPPAFELEPFLRNEAKIDADGVNEYLPLLRKNKVDEEGLRVLATEPKRDIEARLEKWGISVDGDRLKLAYAIVTRFGGGGSRK